MATKFPITNGVRFLRKEKVEFTPHEFVYVEKGGTSHSSTVLGVPEHHVIKTLIMQDEAKNPLIILMHGNLKVSTKELARQAGKKTIKSCDPKTAEKHSGYQVGGTSPFGTRKNMPIYIEKTIADLENILINGGKRGFLVEIKSAELLRVLDGQLVSVGIEQ